MACSSSSRMLNNKDSLEDCMCTICLSILIQPVTLPCGHEMCMPCFEQSLDKASMTCPLCRVRISSWARKATKTKSIVNQARWEQIQKLFPDRVQRRMNGEDDESDKEIREKEEIRLSYQQMVQLSEPGEIRKEYEAELEKLAQQQTEERRREEEASAALIQHICSVEFEEEQRIKDATAAQDAQLAKELEQLINEAKLETPKKTQVTKGSLTTPTGSLTTHKGNLTIPGTKIIQADRHQTPSRKVCRGTAEKRKSTPTHQFIKNNTTLETFFHSASKRAAGRSNSTPLLNLAARTSSLGKQFELSSGGWSHENLGLKNSLFTNKENLAGTVPSTSLVGADLSDLCIDVEVGEPYVKRTDTSSVYAPLFDPYNNVEVGEPYLKRTDAFSVDACFNDPNTDAEADKSYLTKRDAFSVDARLDDPYTDVAVGEPYLKRTDAQARVHVRVGEPHIKSTHQHETVDVKVGDPSTKTADTQTVGAEFREIHSRRKKFREQSVHLDTNSCNRNDISENFVQVNLAAATADACFVGGKRKRAASDDVVACGSINRSQLHTTSQADAAVIGDPLENNVSCSSSSSFFSIRVRCDSELNVDEGNEEASFKPIHPSPKTPPQNLPGNGLQEPFAIRPFQLHRSDSDFTISNDPSLLASLKTQNMGNSECKEVGTKTTDFSNTRYRQSAKYVESSADSEAVRHRCCVDNFMNEVNGSRYSTPERPHSPAVTRVEAFLDECQKSPFSRPSLTEFRMKSLSPVGNEAVECGYNETQTNVCLPNETLGSHSSHRAFPETLPSCSLSSCQRSFLDFEEGKNVRGTASSISARSECAIEVDMFMGSRLFPSEASSSQAGCPSATITTSSPRPVGIFNPETVPTWSEGLCTEITGKGKRLAQKFPNSIISSRNLPKTTCRQAETESERVCSDQTLITPDIQNRADSDHIAKKKRVTQKKMRQTRSTNGSRSENQCTARDLKKDSQVEQISETAVTSYNSGAGGEGKLVHGSSVVGKSNIPKGRRTPRVNSKTTSDSTEENQTSQKSMRLPQTSIKEWLFSTDGKHAIEKTVVGAKDCHQDRLLTRRGRTTMVVEYKRGRKCCGSSSSSPNAISPEKLLRKRKLSSPGLLEVSKPLNQPRPEASETHNGKSSDSKNKNYNENKTLTFLVGSNVCSNRLNSTRKNFSSEKTFNIQCLKNRPEKQSTVSDVSDCLINNSPIQTRTESLSSGKRHSKSSRNTHKTSRPEQKRSDSFSNICGNKDHKADVISTTSSQLSVSEETSVDKNLTQEERDYLLALKLQKQFQLADRLHLNAVRFKGSDDEYCLRQKEPPLSRKRKA